jgi:branched-subunit amino acid ABC-type transport system permease component
MDALSYASGLSAVGRGLARAHAYWFYVARNTFKALFDDGLEDWKALLVITVAMLFTALDGVAAVSIVLQHRVLLPDARQSFRMLWGTVTFSVTAINYFTLVNRRRWSRFEREFQHVPKAPQRLRVFGVWASMILIVAVARWMLLIAWKLPG